MEKLSIDFKLLRQKCQLAFTTTICWQSLILRYPIPAFLIVNNTLSEFHKVCNLVGFQLGSIPVKWGCLSFLRNLLLMTAKAFLRRFYYIRGWDNTSLSYADRLPFIRSAPKFLLDNALCFSLLAYYISANPNWLGLGLVWCWFLPSIQVAWESLCLPEEKGGVGLKRDGEWVEWCHQYLIKGRQAPLDIEYSL